MTEPRVLPFNSARKPAAQPMLTYCVLLSNGRTLDVAAHDWGESSDDEGAGIAYHFYADKRRVLSLEFTEVRSVMCREHMDVAAALVALRSKKA